MKYFHITLLQFYGDVFKSVSDIFLMVVSSCVHLSARDIYISIFNNLVISSLRAFERFCVTLVFWQVNSKNPLTSDILVYSIHVLKERFAFLSLR